MLPLLLLLLTGDVIVAPPVVASADAGVVSCQSVNDCWLAPDGTAVKRPPKFKKRPLPKGDCGKNLLWLRHVLTCEQNVCTSKFVGDAC